MREVLGVGGLLAILCSFCGVWCCVVLCCGSGD